ncbi:MAG: hypothetical protein ACOH1T_11615 [Microbacteriaceae bacterium]
MASTVTGSTSSGISTRPSRWLRGLAVLSAMLAAAALTAVIFLIRAGSEGVSNWPVGWELRSSDNGVLFQLLQDVAAGRTLDWSFSPQVYVFPELPVSALAYLLAGGNVYLYYLLVAAINNAVLFGAIVLVVRVLYRDSGLGSQLLRASVAFTPLVVLPLVGTSWLLQYHLAPTYYFGMYVMLIAAPALFLVRTRAARIGMGIAMALTAASNPLSLVFAFPAFVCVLIVHGMRHGMRSMARPAMLAGGVLAASLIVRVVAFAPLQGTSPLSYIDVEVFSQRLDSFGAYMDYVWTDAASRTVVILGCAAAVLCLIGAALGATLYLRDRTKNADRMLALTWFGLVPLSGLAGTVLLLITHYLYLWPTLVLPLVLLLLALPAPSLKWAAAASVVLLVGVGLASGAPASLTHLDRYFGYRNSETQCLDDSLPHGSEIGYSTFSDARRLSLTSTRGIRLIPLKSNGDQAGWLANLDYIHADTGRFFYINGRGDEDAIDRAWIESRFGTPQQVITCAPDQQLWIYSDASSLDRIAAHFGTRDR